MASFRVDATVIPVPVLEETEWGASPLLWLFFGSNVVAKNRIGGAKKKSTKVVSKGWPFESTSFCGRFAFHF